MHGLTKGKAQHNMSISSPKIIGGTPPTHVAFEHLAMAVVAGHLMGRVRLATPAGSTTHHTPPPDGASRDFGGIAGTAHGLTTMAVMDPDLCACCTVHNCCMRGCRIFFLRGNHHWGFLSCTKFRLRHFHLDRLDRSTRRGSIVQDVGALEHTWRL